MKIYQVGGAVRDSLLGLPVKDRDYVVVGATPEQMTALGYRPVGKDFPVFLHPETQAEYALARTERKIARGYRGFQVQAQPSVTLEQDLARRDLTINAIAMAENGELIDPFSGRADLDNRILRHISPAFVEDPVRILRVARFAARFTEFTVAPETMRLMQEMVAGGEVDALVAERVWQELARGLMARQPSRMFAVLRESGALQKILPELDRLWGVPQPARYHPEIDTGVHVMMVVDYAAAQHYPLAVRFAALTHDLGKGTTPREILPRHIGHEARSAALLKDVGQRLRVPNDCKALAHIVARYHGKVHRIMEMRADVIMRLLQHTDALRQPERFQLFLQACESDSRGRAGLQDQPYPQAAFLRQMLAAATAIDAGAIAQQYSDPVEISTAVFEARTQAIQSVLERRDDRHEV